MIEGKTSSGFEFAIADDVMDDWDVLSALHMIDTGNVGYVTEAAELVLGKEQVKAMKEHVKKLNGRATLTGMVAEFNEILTNGKLKNS